ncbi:hypothetical protein PMIN05_005477 [Paraphaeosphaeria minitans]
MGEMMGVEGEVKAKDGVAVGTRRGCDECRRDGRGVGEEMQERLWGAKGRWGMGLLVGGMSLVRDRSCGKAAGAVCPLLAEDKGQANGVVGGAESGGEERWTLRVQCGWAAHAQMRP